MANNIRRLRLAFLLTPRDLAARMGADETDIFRIESQTYHLDEQWIAAAAHAFCVDAAVITDEEIDLDAIVSASFMNEPAMTVAFCPVAVRYGLLTLIAKFAGMRVARSLDDDELARAAQQMAAFIESETPAANDDDTRFNRLKLSLQIAVLAILQARGVRVEPHFQQVLDEGVPAVAQLIEGFSRIGREPAS
ncbi:MAG: helix-turn-helix transcriptional regulator [Parvularculaceae bacterium]|nr:helix-turn-helix transcriptional regulator [Parvularculaceae bacterium]